MSTSFKKVASVAELLGADYSDAMQQAFPDVEPPYGVPFGYLCLLQLRQPIKRTRGGIIIPDNEQDAERYRVQSALVRAIGTAAFHDRQTGKEWVEGAWFGPGDFIRCPMFGGDRFDVPFGAGDDRVTFVFIREVDAVAPVVGDPLSVKTS